MRILVRDRTLNYHYLVLCVFWLRKLGGGGDVEMGMLLCLSGCGASFFCIHNSPTVSLPKTATPYKHDLSHPYEQLAILNPYRIVEKDKYNAGITKNKWESIKDVFLYVSVIKDVYSFLG